MKKSESSKLPPNKDYISRLSFDWLEMSFGQLVLPWYQRDIDPSYSIFSFRIFNIEYARKHQLTYSSTQVWKSGKFLGKFLDGTE